MRAELLPVGYFHLVFTLPSQIADIAYQNKRVIYGLLLKTSAETMLTIAADPKHLGAKIGITAVLHSWGSAMTHHPHVHMIVPGGGISLDGQRWVSCRPRFFLHVRVLSLLFQRLILEKLAAAHEAGRLEFFGAHAKLAEPRAFAAYLAPLRKIKWVVYAKPPLAGPKAVLAYLSRYTHRVAISNSRLICLDDKGVTFTWKDYRSKGRERYKTMTLETPEFMRRFLLHVLPPGFHRIRHYGLFANGGRAENLARARELLDLQAPRDEPDSVADADQPPSLAQPCPCCGGCMIVIETFKPGQTPRSHTSEPHLGATPRSHTSEPHLGATPRSHTSEPHLGATPRSHTSEPHLGATPRSHTSEPHLGATPHAPRLRERPTDRDDHPAETRQGCRPPTPAPDAARLKAAPSPRVRPARPAGATAKPPKTAPRAAAVVRIIALKRIQRPAIPPAPPSNPHRPSQPHRRA